MNATATVTEDDQKVGIFLAMKDAWERKDWQSCADLMAEDGILHSVMLEPCHGRQNFYERIRKTEKANKEVKLHIRNIGVVGSVLFVERSDEIIVNGLSRFIPTVGILEISNGQITHWREYYDRATMLAAIQEPAHH